MMKRDSRQGFSLIELLVTIGIIATLAALSMPALRNASQRMKDVQCLSNLQQLAKAGTMYIAENNGRLPVTYLAGGSASDNKYYFDALAPYLGLKLSSTGMPYNLSEVFRCPAAANWQKGEQPRSWSNVSYVTVAVQPYNDPRINAVSAAKSVAFMDCYTPSARYGIEAQSQFQQLVPEPGPKPWRHRNGLNAVYWDGHAQYLEQPTYDSIKPVPSA